jgi:hypothetical protein
MASKKKNRVPRIALYLPIAFLALYVRCLAIWNAIKADLVHFPTPYPPASVVDADLAALADTLEEAEKGSPIATTALEGAARKVRETFELLGKYVQSVVRAGSAADAAALIASVLMYESKVGQRSPKPELDVKDTVTSGLVRLVALAIPGVVTYYWEVSTDQVSWSTGPQTAQAHASIGGLTPGKEYYFRFHGFRRDGTMTSPSITVSHLVR